MSNQEASDAGTPDGHDQNHAPQGSVDYIRKKISTGLISGFGNTTRLLTTLGVGLLVSVVLFWIADKFTFLYLSRSYVDQVADVLRLNKHLADAFVLFTFIAAVFFARHLWSFSKNKRRVGISGLSVLLIGHSLVLWWGTRDQFFDPQGNPIKCYVLTRDGKVTYGERPGSDAVTGRQCRPVTVEMLERLNSYRTGKRPQRIADRNPTFFDPRTGEPIVWYYRSKNNEIQLFDLMGFHPDTGDELIPISKAIVSEWKDQNHARPRAPKRVDPDTFVFFDELNGEPRAWYWQSSDGTYEFFDGPGFHPQTGESLKVATRQIVDDWTHPQAPMTPRVPDRIDPNTFVFFDPLNGAPQAWYWKSSDGEYEFYDSSGFHPRTGDALKIATRDIVEDWKSHHGTPRQIDPKTYPFFDPRTGRAQVWYWRSRDGKYAFYDAPGFHPQSGEKLALVTRDVIEDWNNGVQPSRIPSPPPNVSPPQNTGVQLRQRTADFLDALYRTLSNRNADLLAFWSNIYADQVTFFGQSYSRGQVIGELQKAAARWPMEEYSIKPGSLQIDCDEQLLTCRARGFLDFDARSPARNQRSWGVASFEYVLKFTSSGTAPKILLESGETKARNLEPLAFATPPAQANAATSRNIDPLVRGVLGSILNRIGH